MKNFIWQIIAGLVLIVTSIFIYITNILIFKNPHDTFYYLLTDLAFLPMQVFFVSLLLDRLISKREKQEMLKKLNMVIGVFFSDVGNSLIQRLSGFDPDFESFRKMLIIKGAWNNQDFASSREKLASTTFYLNSGIGDLNGLKNFMLEKRAFLLSLLENPNLLEHQTFTELLWAVFHISEELSYRENLNDLPPNDLDHLSTDLKRVYVILIGEWLEYMKHLKNDYPYLFSLAVRMNPFDSGAGAVIR